MATSRAVSGALKRPRAASLFQVLAEDPERGIFLLEDPALGFGFQMPPLPFGDEGTQERLNGLLNLDWPTDTLIQFTLFTSPDLGDLADQKIGDPRSLAGRIEKRTRAYRHLGGIRPMAVLEGARIRRCELYLTVKLPLATKIPKEADFECCERLLKSCEESLNGLGLEPRILHAGDWLRFHAVVGNGSAEASWRGHAPLPPDPTRVIRDQVLDFDACLEVSSDSVRLPSGRARMLSVKRYPERFAFGGALRYLGDLLSGSRGIKGNVILGMTLHYPDAESSRNRLSASRQWVVTQSGGPMARFLPKLRLRQQQFDLLFEAFDDGDRPLRGCFGLALLIEEGDGTEALAQARGYFRELGFQLLEDRYIALPAFLNLLPFGADLLHVRESQRFRTFGTRHVVPLLPLFADWRGSGGSMLSLISRSGQAMGFSLFDSPTNYNATIAAQSGSGKSFLTNEIIVRALAEGMRVWVIDIGRSYQNLAEHLGGTFLSFGSEHPVSLNPFERVSSWQEEADMLTALVSTMASPNDPLSDFQRTGLKRILRDCFEWLGPKLTIDEIAGRLLEETDPRLRDLGSQLDPFTSRGEYGAYFTGKEVTDFDHPLTVLELEALKGRRHLQQVVLLDLILKIQQAMTRERRDLRKIVIIDESWDLLTEGVAATFIEHGYRRFRKYGGAAITLTQSVNDLYRSETGRAIAENSAHLMLLGQKNEAIEQLKSEKRLPLGEAGYALLKSVHTVKGRYSEVFILGETGAGIGRLVVDPFKRLLFSTHPDEIAAIRSLRDRGHSLEGAIETLLSRSQAS